MALVGNAGIEVFTGIFLEMHPMDPDETLSGAGANTKGPSRKKRMGILGDLIPLGKIGVKIVFPLKDADGIDGTSRGQPGPDSQSNRLGIEDG